MGWLRWSAAALIAALAFGLGASACSPRATPSYDLEFRQLDTLVVAGTRIDGPGQANQAPRPPYRGSRTRAFDLLHTALDLHIDWEDGRITGTALLQLRPLARAREQLRLDARGMRIHNVTRPDHRPLPFSYDDPVLSIRLGQTLSPDDTIDLVINYSTGPAGRPPTTDDRGFYLIDPPREDPEAGPQLWTQGETAFNSRWFPTLDQPNERATQDIRLTVPDSFQTLSNGRLVNSRPNPNATRTDHWRLDLPHAPYLAMVAVGKFAVRRDTVDGLPFQYYVDPAFAGAERRIFPHTPDMLRFFSEYLGYPYPWPKYAQVAVRDFVAGAMENTTAVIFGDFMLDTARMGRMHRYNERIVAHELAHHWFGNLVTCESWANLALNEGFASYGEYLWLEKAYGRADADAFLEYERDGYFVEAKRRQHPLIRYRHNDPERLFDRHAYNKGAAVVHMLRHYLGEAVFRAGLRQYLRQHAFRAVEVHDLRLAFEAVSGEDLNWFFDQWFLQPGHPQLEVRSNYLAEAQELQVVIEQQQDSRQAPDIFILPTILEVVGADGAVQRLPVRIERRKQTIRVPVPAAPAAVVLDPERILLAELKRGPVTTRPQKP